MQLQWHLQIGRVVLVNGFILLLSSLVSFCYYFCPSRTNKLKKIKQKKKQEREREKKKERQKERKKMEMKIRQFLSGPSWIIWLWSRCFRRRTGFLFVDCRRMHCRWLTADRYSYENMFFLVAILVEMWRLRLISSKTIHISKPPLFALKDVILRLK